MSENGSVGCGLWGFLGAIALVFLGLFAGNMSSHDSSSEAAAIVASPTVSETLVVRTLEPQEVNTYFVVENNQVSYGYYPTLGEPCYYVLSGHVLDLNRKPYTEFVVNIKTVDIEGVVPASGYAFPDKGSFTEDGISGWVALLPMLTDYEIWLTTEVNGTELSPHILVHMADCTQNRAIVNFIQIKPLT